MSEKRLSELLNGQVGTILRINAGRCLRGRLMAMGFGTGSEVKVMRRGRPGPFIISIKDCCRVAVGFGEAAKIIVRTGD